MALSRRPSAKGAVMALPDLRHQLTRILPLILPAGAASAVPVAVLVARVRALLVDPPSDVREAIAKMAAEPGSCVARSRNRELYFLAPGFDSGSTKETVRAAHVLVRDLGDNTLSEKTAFGSLLLRMRIAFMDAIPRSKEQAIPKAVLLERVRREFPSDLNENTLKSYFHQLVSDSTSGVRRTANQSVYLEPVAGIAAPRADRARTRALSQAPVDHAAPTAPTRTASGAARPPRPIPLVPDASVRSPGPKKRTATSTSANDGVTQPGFVLSTPKNPISAWGRILGDADAGRVFDYLEKHGALSEGEMVGMLGNARKARAFAARFEGFLDRLTFEVEIIVNSDGKQYRKR